MPGFIQFCKLRIILLCINSGFSLTPYLESFTPTFGLGTPVFQEFLQIYIVGLLLFLKDVSGTPIFKILVRTLIMKIVHFEDSDTAPEDLTVGPPFCDFFYYL